MWLLWAGEIALAAAAGGYLQRGRQRSDVATAAFASVSQGSAQRYGSGKWSNWPSRSI
jgi:hypothetical protein